MVIVTKSLGSMIGRLFVNWWFLASMMSFCLKVDHIASLFFFIINIFFYSKYDWRYWELSTIWTDTSSYCNIYHLLSSEFFYTLYLHKVFGDKAISVYVLIDFHKAFLFLCVWQILFYPCHLCFKYFFMMLRYIRHNLFSRRLFS